MEDFSRLMIVIALLLCSTTLLLVSIGMLIDVADTYRRRGR